MRRRLFVSSVAIVAATVIPVAAARVAAGPSMKVSASVLGFGQSVTFRGSSGSGGASVELWAHACGFTSAAPIAMTTAAADGTYQFKIEPMLNSIYTVKVGTAASGDASVKVRPLVQLHRVSAGVFGVDVSVGNGQWFTTKVALQLFNIRKKAWQTVAAAPLKANSDPGDLIAVSSATIRKAVPSGSKVRATLSQSSVGTCYIPATSPPVGA